MKYLLDTNVVSNYAKPRRDLRVDAWLGRLDDSDLYLSTLTIAELWQGIDRLPSGEKKSALAKWVDEDLMSHFFGRTVGYTLDAARNYGQLVERARTAGKHPDTMDVLLASTALAEGMVVATLNRKHFEVLGVPLVEF